MPIAINNPFISVSPDKQTITIGYYDGSQPGQIKVLTASSSNLAFYQSNPNIILNTSISTGPISYPSGAAIESSKSIGVTLANGEVAGLQTDSSILANTAKFNLQIDGKKLIFIPAGNTTSTNSSSSSTSAKAVGYYAR